MMIPMLTLLASALAAAGGSQSLNETFGFMEASLWENQQLAWLALSTKEPLNRYSGVPTVLAHLERAARDAEFVVSDGALPDDAFAGIFEKMFRLRDTSDFDALRFVDLLYAYGGHPVASETLWGKVESALLDFKYWYTDPTPQRTFEGKPVVDLMWYWTENHVLIFKTCEYLVGERFPERVFGTTGMTGKQHAKRAEPFLLQWFHERSKLGFTEWHSDVYYDFDIRPLLSLVEWAEDEAIQLRAAMVLDLVLLDMALHTHHGTFGATHGRSYVKNKVSADREDTFDASKMLFNDTTLPLGGGGTTAAALARAKRFRLPEVIRRIATYDEPMVDRERMNLPLDEDPPASPATAKPPEAPFGWDYRNEEYLPFWWSMSAQTAWQLLPLTFEVAERENLWDAQFLPVKSLRDLAWVAGDMKATVVNAQTLAKQVWPFLNQGLLKEVNTYTYRTAHYMLSTAQDYRKGLRGSQTHTWQGTLAERAMVFTTHPSYLPVKEGSTAPPGWNWQREDEPGPGYWTGESSQPRSAQHKNVGISIYAPQYDPFPLLGVSYRDETHAYFPVSHFDEVIRAGHWTFGRKDDAYVALYSWREVMWRRGQPEVFENAGLDFDLVAGGGAKNVWIVECGCLDEWPGGFDKFRAAFGNQRVAVTETKVAFNVVFQSPSQGTIKLAWEGPLLVGSEAHAIASYPRFDNPFVQVQFGETRFNISDGEYCLELDFNETKREAAAHCQQDQNSGQQKRNSGQQEKNSVPSIGITYTVVASLAISGAMITLQ